MFGQLTHQIVEGGLHARRRIVSSLLYVRHQSLHTELCCGHRLRGLLNQPTEIVQLATDGLPHLREKRSHQPLEHAAEGLIPLLAGLPYGLHDVGQRYLQAFADISPQVG